MKRTAKSFFCLLWAATLLVTGCSNQSEQKSQNKSLLDAKNPMTIEVWNYYNGEQQDAFNKLVAEFNDSDGQELGIKVKASSIGDVSDLEENVLAAINGQVGAKEIPNIFAAYADTAYAVDQQGFVVDLTEYLTEDEIAEYMDSYIDEGRFSSEDSLKIFPIAKATEVFMLNKTDWDKFAEATGTSLEEISTLEGITDISKRYYEWTDSLTDTPDDGRAFFGRDALANYFIIGAKQLGTEIFSVQQGVPTLDFNKETVRTLWDNYYVPYINGYFSSSGKFRSDDIKTGNVISFVGSTAGATFFPKQVAQDDTTMYDIDMLALQCPKFAGGDDFAVQQGAGMVVIEKENKAEVEASVEFLKWFTNAERNIQFAVSSGYLPVKKKANDLNLINENILQKDDSIVKVLDASMEQIQENKLYTSRAFENSTSLRNILEYSLADKAVKDRADVMAMIAEGVSHDDAAAKYYTDDNFNAWYEETLASLEDLMSQK